MVIALPIATVILFVIGYSYDLLPFEGILTLPLTAIAFILTTWVMLWFRIKLDEEHEWLQEYGIGKGWRQFLLIPIQVIIYFIVIRTVGGIEISVGTILYIEFMTYVALLTSIMI